ncbi:hypothetical protein BGX26_013049 [Mortierella sp. AD094]|nr:hypothetical protein BGX26_013049 [Mortierella sp. AD094]
MSFSFFGILLIKDKLALYITQHDLAQCVIVSKNWYLWFSPMLWGEPMFKSSHEAMGLQWRIGLKRHQKHVQFISDSWITNMAVTELKAHGEPNWIFSNLRSIEFNFDEYELAGMKTVAFRFIEKALTLETLSVEFDYYQDYIHKQLAPILYEHPRLQNMRIAGGDDFHPLFIQEIIEACSHMTSLNLAFSRDTTYSQEATTERVHQASIAAQQLVQMRNTQIRELSIHLSCTYKELSILGPLLMRCQLLEKLALVKICDTFTLGFISKKLQQGCCPRLKDVDIGNFSDIEHSEEDIEEFLRSLGRNGSGKCGGDSGIGLKAIIFSSSTNFGDLPLMALAQCHSRTLAHLRCDSTVNLNKVTMDYCERELRKKSARKIMARISTPQLVACAYSKLVSQLRVFPMRCGKD